MDDLMQQSLEERKQHKVKILEENLGRVFRSTFRLSPGEMVHAPHIHPECFLIRGYYMRIMNYMYLHVYVPPRMFTRERWAQVKSLDDLAELEAKHPGVYVGMRKD